MSNFYETINDGGTDIGGNNLELKSKCPECKSPYIYLSEGGNVLPLGRKPLYFCMECPAYFHLDKICGSLLPESNLLVEIEIKLNNALGDTDTQNDVPKIIVPFRVPSVCK